MFQSVDSKPDFVKLERRILKFWREQKVLEKYLHRNDSSDKRFSFLDGPITANNPMGVHHAWGRTLKDLYQRFKNMQGFKQRFQNGFDNQGLWVEVEVEKKLGFKSKKDIEKFGVAKFVEKCKEHTLEFSQVQIKQSQRLGYFMDWGNDYYTLSDENNYAIWHFLKKVNEDGNLYKGRDSVPWCPRCGTAISQHEILNEEYQELTHDSVYLELPIVGRINERFLVWTTTPWTIPANVALAIHPDLEYQLVKGKTGTNLWVAGSLVEKIFGSDAEVAKKVKGKELVGFKYTGPFDELPAVQGAKKENPETFHSVVVAEELVNEEEGTGIVHIATGCGTEDFRLGQRENLPILPAIDEAANYLEGFGKFSGKNAKEKPELILDCLGRKEPAKEKSPTLGTSSESDSGELAGSGESTSDPSHFLYKIEPFTHRYPVCWRCKTELVWRVVDEWYIAMDDTRHKGAKNYRTRLQKVIKDVRWIPSFGYDRELDWLRNMEDWLISKKRYWGLALPIWECPCGHFEVIGSKEELEKRAVGGWKEFEEHSPHRPWVDAVKVDCEKCGEPMSRISDVGTPWLDAGIVSYSTLKYFEDRNYWQDWFPADLVLECFPGQFKNWFYSLLAMSVVLEGTAPFKTLLGHALVKDERGEEMHKSKGNAIVFEEAAEKMGVDAMRWLYVTQDPTHDLRFGYGLTEEVRRRFFLILWNCYKFFVTYAELDGWQPTGDKKQVSKHVLDRWILSRLNNLVKLVTERLGSYDNSSAARALEEFVVKDFSTWYIRRSRDRIGPSVPNGQDNDACYQTLYQVLGTLVGLLAPFVPFLSEEMYRNLKGGAADSVHLEDWPKAAPKMIDEDLEKQMTLVREICEKGHAMRKAAGVKVRQPLGEMAVTLPQNVIAQFTARPSKERETNFASTDLVKLIKEELNVKDVKFEEGKELEVKLDITVTPELKVEGTAREMVRAIQSARRKAGCRMDEEVKVSYPDNSGTAAVVKVAKLADDIKKATLATELTAGDKYEIKR